ncbi:MAG: hypothetical protein PSU94_16290 [Lacunisphaera sp.]|nr:hypothetical protein [Lacunisphaera sp.]
MANKSSPLAGASGLFPALVVLVALTGCETDDSRGRSGYYDRPSSRGSVMVVYEDDYDYYPAYEVYYSRSRHEYVYRDGNSWVRRSEPSGISISVLLSTPSVRMDFRDSPEQHHSAVIRSYPRNWSRGGSGVQVQAAVVFEDDYIYYPGYEIYYSSNRHEYVYRDGSSWVRRSEPRGVSLNVLLAAPSVRMDFRDSPERHHSTVVQSYPRSWQRANSAPAARNDRREEQKAQPADRDNRRNEPAVRGDRRDDRNDSNNNDRNVRPSDQKEEKKVAKPDAKNGRKDDKKSDEKKDEKKKDRKDGDKDDDEKDEKRKNE